jgi:hypothetical protein
VAQFEPKQNYSKSEKVAQFEPENYPYFVAQFKPKQLAQFHRNGWHISNRNSHLPQRLGVYGVSGVNKLTTNDIYDLRRLIFNESFI